MRNIWRAFINGPDGQPVLYQTPNAPLLVGLLFTAGARIIRDGPPHAALTLVGHLSLVVWSILEIGWGVSYFRRVLGALVLVATLMSLLGK